MKNKLIIVLLLIVAASSGVMAAPPSDNLGFIQVDVKFLGTLNLNQDKLIKFIIEIPQEYKGKAIDTSTVTVNGFNAESAPECKDCNGDSGGGGGGGSIFDGSEETHQLFVSEEFELLGSINCVDQVQLIVGGYLKDGTRIEGQGFIRVINCKKGN